MQTVLTNLILLDPSEDQLLPHHQVLIEDGIIRRVERGRVGSDKDARIVDLQGRTLMPGLIDCHVHLHGAALPPAPTHPTSLTHVRAIVTLRDLLHSGITTIRDAAGTDYGMKQAVALGVVPGPRLFVAGRAVGQTGGASDSRSVADQRGANYNVHLFPGTGRIADGVPDIRVAVRDEIRRGADHIKIMAGGCLESEIGALEDIQLTVEELRSAAEEANRAGKYPMAQVHAAPGIRRCIEAGVRTIEHGSFLDEDTAAEMARHGAYLSPCLSRHRLIAERGSQFGFSANSIEKARHLCEIGGRPIEIARRAGVPVAFSTDLTEMPDAFDQELRARLDIETPLETIRSATVVGAEIVGLAGKVGTISEGAVADLIAVDGDPLSDVTLLGSQGRHLAFIMKEGLPVKDLVTGEPVHVWNNTGGRLH